MDAETFLKTAIRPEQWFQKSRSLRRSADRLWDCFLSAWMEYAKTFDRAKQTGDEAKFGEAFEYLRVAQMLYGLALETAFKARILREAPGAIEFDMSADGTGAVQSVTIKQFGVPIKEGHDLVALADKAGIFRRGDGALFAEESDFAAFRDILLHLREAVLWEARYPVPTRSDAVRRAPEDAPARILGHYIRDWIDPALDKLVGPESEVGDSG